MSRANSRLDRALPQGAALRQAAVRQAAVAVLLCAPALALMACDPGDLGSSSLDGLKPEKDTVDKIPLNPVSGKLAGKPFALKDARMHIDRRPGYERVDVLLRAEVATAPCKKLTNEKAAGIWIRFGGVTSVDQKEYRRSPKKPGKTEVHMEVTRDGRWFGNGNSAALLLIEQFDPSSGISGVLSVCFADEARSCASGNFVATYCSNPLDEPPRSFGVSRQDVQRTKDKLKGASSKGAQPAGSTSASTDGGATVGRGRASRESRAPEEGQQ